MCGLDRSESGSPRPKTVAGRHIGCMPRATTVEEEEEAMPSCYLSEGKERKRGLALKNESEAIDFSSQSFILFPPHK